MRRELVEPTLLGLRCTGKDPEKVKRLEEEIRARQLMMAFYKLDRPEQLVVAAASEELILKRK